MRRIVMIVLGLVIAAVILVGGGYLALVATSGSGEASQAIDAPEMAAETADAVVYRIIPEESEVRFLINEVLRGEDVTAVGATDQVAGDIVVDLANPSASEVGMIRVNARTLETDQGNRNRALRSFILRSAEEQFEFIEFQPTTVTGLPESVSVGDSFSFQISGDLTITGTTNPVTFDATASLSEADRLTGQAVTTVLYPDFNLTIPSAPFVASVEDEVQLEIDFVATQIEE